MIVYANLDQETRWARITLPQHVLRRISAAAGLLAAFAPEGEPVVIHAPVPIDAARVTFATVDMRAGVPPRWDLAWADPRAEQPNDRRVGLRINAELGTALPGARTITSLAELDAHLAADGANGGIDHRWVCKALWTAAGRDRAHGQGELVDGELRVHVGRLLERFHTLIFEPWLDRVLDLGVCGDLAPDGTVTAQKAHTLLSDPRGTFLGIDVLEPALTADEHAMLARTLVHAGRNLHELGYAGPFTIDAFVYREHGHRKLHPLCELNARYTFGHVARALAKRLGIRKLGFGTAHDGARVLVAPAADDPFTAWGA